MKPECGNGLTRFFGVAASHKQCQSFDVDDDEKSDGNRNELMTTMMRTKRMMRMMRMMGMMRMMRMLRMRMKIKMRMVIMMRRAVVGLQNLLSQQAKTPQCINRFSPSVVSKRNLISKKKRPPNGSPNLHKDVRDNATYVW